MLAGPWIEQGKKLWGEYYDHIVRWMAMRVQHPDIKINHCLFLGSKDQGIGKDSWLQALRRAVGPWNFKEKAVAQTLAPDKNSFLEAVIVLISEVHDLGDKRQNYYDFTKDWMAAPPSTLDIADKWIIAHSMFNMNGIIFTGNHLTDGLYLVAGDRRHGMFWSMMTPDQFDKDKFWDWYRKENGLEHAAAYLATLDVTDFDVYAAPPKTDAFWSVVNACQILVENKLREALDNFDVDMFGEKPPCRPEAVTVDMLVRELARESSNFGNELYELLTGPKSQRIAHKFHEAGYGPVPNPKRPADGYWRIDDKRVVVYAPTGMQPERRLKAAMALVMRERRRAVRLKAKA